MAAVHRNNDDRACGATTTVIGQSSVFVNNQLVSVDGDTNSDGGGALIASGSSVRAGGKPIIVDGDSASADSLCIPLGGDHCAPNASSGSGDVSAY